MMEPREVIQWIRPAFNGRGPTILKILSLVKCRVAMRQSVESHWQIQIHKQIFFISIAVSDVSWEFGISKCWRRRGPSCWLFGCLLILQLKTKFSIPTFLYHYVFDPEVGSGWNICSQAVAQNIFNLRVLKWINSIHCSGGTEIIGQTGRKTNGFLTIIVSDGQMKMKSIWECRAVD